ncbi:MAG: hypothetical protein DRO93_10515 [Candidatus Thorarchaeota archaeon]|nr:MAG: hypothetical protein DRO93_10515 [Candidatus Thorarchaeota archaeon]
MRRRKRSGARGPAALQRRRDVFVFAMCDIVGGKFAYQMTTRNNSDAVTTNVTTTITLDELKEDIDGWICLHCGAPLERRRCFGSRRGRRSSVTSVVMCLR